MTAGTHKLASFEFSVLYLKGLRCSCAKLGARMAPYGVGVSHMPHRSPSITQAFGLGREVVGCASGDALWVSRKRDDQLRAS